MIISDRRSQQLCEPGWEKLKVLWATQRQNSCDFPYVLKSCAEFIETHGIVDGIYRLSGITSNIQRLR
uniref:Rho-GAP domain-containing protein n=1 Tax=Mus spicilegus TaxID=10103 RepID=A0A8C6HLI0_MUSSI